MALRKRQRRLNRTQNSVTTGERLTRRQPVSKRLPMRRQPENNPMRPLPISSQASTLPVQDMQTASESGEQKVERMARKPWMNDLASMTLARDKKTCKKKPSQNKGDGKSRDFVPWCDKKG